MCENGEDIGHLQLWMVPKLVFVVPWPGSYVSLVIKIAPSMGFRGKSRDGVVEKVEHWRLVQKASWRGKQGRSSWQREQGVVLVQDRLSLLFSPLTFTGV